MRTLLATLLTGTVLATSAAWAQDFRIGLQEDPDLLDPHRARTFVGRIVFTSLCDKLIDVDAKLNFVPELATEWAWSNDNRTLTFKLRQDALFHDGTPFNAEAAKANIERARTLPDSLRKSELASVESVEVVDEFTVALNLSKPDATLLAQLSDRAGMMLSPATFEAEVATNPICSGPYKFASRVQNDRIVLEKFAEHREAADYHFGRLIFQPIPDSTVRLANLRAGDIDMLERLNPSDAESVRNDDALQFMPVAGLGYQGITINTGDGEKADNPLGRDKRVRQALQLAIGRDVINQVVGQGLFEPAQQPFPKASPYNSPAFPVVQRDPEAAKALLAEAGVENVSFELSFGNNTTTQAINELIQAMAAEAGFNISLRPTEFAAMQQEMKSGNYQAAQIGWSGRVDPDGNLHQFVTCKGTLNDSKYCNPEVDRLLNDARVTPDVEKRQALYEEAQRILQDDLPIIYVYHQPWPFVLSSAVSGFTAYPDGMVRLKGVTLAR
ncbi:ABC transporter substrate-binding protein [Nitratireductor sp. ZSWI3]|uniref:ABC transporter substrate-binding protein n=1 Tax=Nitratireductor sp. ZSWI3 TaxID=2966359 RepID=UPI002150467E|nr:ABC transporter substrate-binding protein [Nitratireductor sp. ZSWI3]MCR4264653.1 ABC transporter substrate-binding protein [Nitratireductor sp. ZSWI3]